MALTYAAIGDVNARIGIPAVDSSSSPNTTQVTTWLTDAQAELDSRLSAIGHGTVPDAVAICKTLIVNYAAAQVYITRAGQGGDGDNEHGQSLLQKWLDDLQDIRDNPEWWSGLLSAGAPTAGVRRRRAGGFYDASDPPDAKILKTEKF